MRREINLIEIAIIIMVAIVTITICRSFMTATSNMVHGLADALTDSIMNSVGL